MAAPLSTFDGTLRQIAPDCLTAQGEHVLRACAPRFLPLTDEERNQIYSRKAKDISSYVTHVHVPARPYRRFSGDYFSDWDEEHRLSAGNYFSVSNDASGQDYGTLVNELNAYRSANADFFCLFIDCLNPQEVRNFGLAPSAHVLAVVANADALLPALAPSAPDDLGASVRESADAGKPFVMRLGCAVVKASVEGVLDLRYPEAQKWFFDRYVVRAPIATQASRFLDILPELQQLPLGGSTGSNIRLQAIGADLRRLGLNALIYPSARTDVAVQYAENRLLRWKGWNIVMYRSGMPRDALHVDMGGWETSHPRGVRLIEFPADHRDHGWQVVGLEELHHSWYEQVMAKRGLPG